MSYVTEIRRLCISTGVVADVLKLTTLYWCSTLYVQDGDSNLSEAECHPMFPVGLSQFYNIGGVAQWLERRSLTGKRSLIYAWSTVTCDHFLGKVSAMGKPIRLTQPSIPSGSVNEQPVETITHYVPYRVQRSALVCDATTSQQLKCAFLWRIRCTFSAITAAGSITTFLSQNLKCVTNWRCIAW